MTPRPPILMLLAVLPTLTDDHALTDRLLAGDEQAFRELIRRWQGPMLRLARVHVHSQAAAEEVVQDTWLGVLNGLANFERRSSLKTWVMRILVNRARTRGVRDRRSVPMSSLGDGQEGVVDPARFAENGHWRDPPKTWAQTAETIVGNRELVALVEAAIDELPEMQKAVLTLRDVEGVDAAEVCTLLDVTDGNQRILLHRARTKVRTVLEKALAEGM